MAKLVEINGRLVGEGQPIYFIAEIGINHNGDLNIAKDLIDVAVEAGCDAVKFQLFKIDQLFAPEILSRSEEHRRRIAWELPDQFIPDLAKYAHDLGLEFGCTPFYLKAVDILEPHVDFYKIASYELLWADLIQTCSQTGKPLMFSTGMATQDEIQSAYDICVSARANDISIFHCNSSYPTPLDQVNLKVMDRLRDQFKHQRPLPRIGWSDHSRNAGVIQRAVHHYGAEVIEFHLDLDEQGAEYAAGHCWLPHEMGTVIRQIKSGLTADGDGSLEFSPSEASEREWRADPSDGLRPLMHVRKDFR